MTYGQVVDTSFEDLVSNQAYFQKLFRESKLLIFPGLHLSEEQNSFLRHWFGYGFYGHHDELHEFTVNRKSGGSSVGPEEQLVSWHLENLDDPCPPVAVGWNMTKFDCPKGHGSTGFINMIDIYSKLDQELKDFFDNISFAHFLNARSDEDGVIGVREKIAAGETTVLQTPRHAFRSGAEISTPVRSAVVPHPFTEELVLRYMPIDENVTLLDPKQRAHADDAVVKLLHDPENQVWWEWAEGDYVFADLFVTAHSVRGGFSLGERVLDVAFGVIGDYPEHLREPWTEEDARAQTDALGGGSVRGIDGKPQ